MDTVDMLHTAEDAMGLLRVALEAVLPHLDKLPLDVAAKVSIALTANADYCRCDLNEDGVCEDETCGCPGAHDHAHAFAN